MIPGVTGTLLDPARAPLLIAALSVAFFHTLVGVDHYLPFVVLGRARRWSMRKVVAITAACGVGHVIGSVALGFVGIGLGVGLGKMEWIESVRGEAAAWGLIAFGLAYMAWALIRLRRGARHRHLHAHADGELHDHDHDHHAEHLHAHGAAAATFWGLFVVFALGPCEPLIPVLMAPAFEQDWWLVAQVTAVFSLVTIGVMVGMAVAGTLGLRLAPLRAVERYGNVAAGAAIALSGVAIRALGI